MVRHLIHSGSDGVISGLKSNLEFSRLRDLLL